MIFDTRRKPDPSRSARWSCSPGRRRGSAARRPRLLGARGYRLGLIDRDEAAARRPGGRAAGARRHDRRRAADVRDGAGVQGGRRAIERAIGPIEVLVACAGVGTALDGARPRPRGVPPDARGQRARRGADDRGGLAGDVRARDGAHRRDLERRRLSRPALDARLLGVEGRARDLPRRAPARPEAARGADHDGLSGLRPDGDDRRHAVPPTRSRCSSPSRRPSTSSARSSAARATTTFPLVAPRSAWACSAGCPDRVFDWVHGPGRARGPDDRVLRGSSA